MNNILSKCFIFAAGAAIGSAVAWKIVKTKYEKIANEEIESVREMYAKRAAKEEDIVEEEPDADVDEELVERSEYSRIIEDAEYGEPDEEVEDDMVGPYVIPPDDFDEEGYDTMSLYYYDDGVLENMHTKEVIENVDELVGTESLTHFGEYEDDSVFVRNDRLRLDIEILRVSGNYGGY